MSYDVEIEPWLDQVTPVSERFQGMLAEVVSGVTGSLDGRAVEIGRAFNLGRTMSGRLKRAMVATDPTEVALLLPGRPTMTRLIAQLDDLGVPRKTIDDFQEAYDAFLEQISKIASSQQELASVLSGHDSDLLQQTMRRQRQAHFKATTDLYGGYADSYSILAITRPNPETPLQGDVIAMQGYSGLRRTGTMDPLTVFACASLTTAHGEPRRVLHLDGQAFDMDGDGALVRSLSSSVLPDSRAFHSVDSMFQVYHSDDLPLNKPFDLVTASYHENWLKNFKQDSNDVETRDITTSMPTRITFFDQIVHKDMWPGLVPRLRVYRDTGGPRGQLAHQVWFREVAHIHTLEEISTQRLLIPPREAPKHAELARYLIEQSGIDLADYRAYRLTMPYPVVGQGVWVFWEGDGAREAESPK